MNYVDIINHIIPPDDVPAPCPRCGRAPSLCETYEQSWFECRKWFGLRICTLGPRVFEGWEAGQWSRRSAAYAWNRMVMQVQNRRRG
jgi:hypothetical protein